MPDQLTEYTDLRKHTWDVKLTLDGSERIDREDFSAVYEKPFSLLSPSQEIFSRLAVDRRLIMVMIYALLRPEIYERAHYRTIASAYEADPKKFPTYESLDDLIHSEFNKAIDGEVIDKACKAFWRSLADFFPGQRNTILKFSEIQEKGLQIVGEELEGMLDESLPILKESLKESKGQFMSDARRKFKELIGSNSPASVDSLDGLVGSGEP